MDKETQEYFRGILQEEMRVLLEEAGKTVSEMTADNTNFPDPNDRATQESDRTFELRIRDRERKLEVVVARPVGRIDACLEQSSRLVLRSRKRRQRRQRAGLPDQLRHVRQQP